MVAGLSAGVATFVGTNLVFSRVIALIVGAAGVGARTVALSIIELVLVLLAGLAARGAHRAGRR